MENQIKKDDSERERDSSDRLGYLLFLENLERINGAILKSMHLGEMMENVLDAVLDIFECDRAWLLFPCDPDAPSWSVPMERTRPEYPGVFSRDEEFPMEQITAESLRHQLETSLPITAEFAAGEAEWDPEDRYHVRSTLVIAVRPKRGSPWSFGLHQCSGTRTWSLSEKELFTEISRRIGDALGNQLLLRDLQVSEDKFRTLVEQLPTASYTASLDETSTALYVSPQIEKILGFPSDKYKTNPNFWTECIHDEDREWVLSKMRLAYESGESLVSEYRMLSADGKTVWVRDEAVIIRDDEGTPRYLQGILLDVSARKQAEEEKANLEKQLRRAQKLETIGTLAGGIAHDFNNILAPILGYTDMALLKLKKTDPIYSNLEHVLEGAIRAKDLVQQILQFSKQIQKDMEPLSLQPLIKEAMKLLRPSIPTTVEIRQEIDPSCEMVRADATQMHQIIVNLCTNAWQSMEKRGGTLTIRLQKSETDETTLKLHSNIGEGKYVRLSVIDTGPGMDSETLDRVFEPFFTTKTVDEGTGLGLSVVHGIVRNHKGDILVDSEPGKGSAFHVYLPITTGRKTAGTEKKIIGGTETVMVVDDELVIGEMLKTMLENLGYKADVFQSGLDAAEAMEQQPLKYNLLVSDLTMPQMTGLDLADRLHGVAPTFPIVIMTGFGDKLTVPTLERYGIKQVLSKPISVKELAEAVRVALAPE